MEQRAATAPLQRTRFWLVLLSSAHVVPAAFISASVLFRQFCFGRPTLSFPCGFQSRACLVMLDAGFRSMWPIQPHLRFLISVSVGVCFVLSHSCSFETTSGHLMLRMFLRQDLCYNNSRRMVSNIVVTTSLLLTSLSFSQYCYYCSQVVSKVVVTTSLLLTSLSFSQYCYYCSQVVSKVVVTTSLLLTSLSFSQYCYYCSKVVCNMVVTTSLFLTSLSLLSVLLLLQQSGIQHGGAEPPVVIIIIIIFSIRAGE